MKTSNDIPSNGATPNIGDDELLAFALGDGLEPARDGEIRAALAASPALADRLAQVSAGLQQAFEAPEPSASFEARLWHSISSGLPRTVIADSRPSIGARVREWLRGFGAPQLAFASVMLVTLAVGYLLGRNGAPVPGNPGPTPTASLLGDDAGQRVLAAYLAVHLESTERLMLVASNSPEQSDTAQALAADLVEANRTYAAAVERAGNAQLAAFLREIEPVLIELANPDALTEGAAPEEIRRRDLAFKTRAAAALARRAFGPNAPQAL